MAKVITFGEIMLRLATPGYLRFNQAKQFEATFGGGEANVAVSLANYGLEAEFVTRFPKNDIAESCIKDLHSYGVGTKHCVFGGERLGIYFLETGAVARPSKVVYDRAHSSIAQIEKGMIDWDKVFEGATWFHWTGITPAISQGAADVEGICHGGKNLVVLRIEIVEDGLGEFILHGELVQELMSGSSTLHVMDGVISRVRAKYVEHAGVVVAYCSDVELLSPTLRVVHTGKIEKDGAAELQDLFLGRHLASERVAEDSVDFFEFEILCIEGFETVVRQTASHFMEEVVTLLKGIQKVLIVVYLYS